MSKLACVAGYGVVWLIVTATCGYVGMWWPIRNLEPHQGWAGDGIGILLYGTLGLVAGGTLSLAALIAFAVVRSRRKAAQQGVPADRPRPAGSAGG